MIINILFYAIQEKLYFQSSIVREQKLEHLTNRVNKLESAKKKLLESMKAVVEACDEIEASYNILRAKYMEFTNELHVLKMVDEKLSDEILDLN